MSSLTGFTGDEELQEQITAANDLATTQKQRIDDILSMVGAVEFTGALNPGNLPINALTSGSVSQGNLQDNSVGSQQLRANSVGSSELLNEAVITAKIDNLAVTDTKLANNAVVTAKLANNAVVTAKLADNAVDLTKISDSSMSTSLATNTLALRDGNGACNFGALTGTTVSDTTGNLRTAVNSKQDALTFGTANGNVPKFQAEDALSGQIIVPTTNGIKIINSHEHDHGTSLATGDTLALRDADGDCAFNDLTCSAIIGSGTTGIVNQLKGDTFVVYAYGSTRGNSGTAHILCNASGTNFYQPTHVNDTLTVGDNLSAFDYDSTSSWFIIRNSGLGTPPATGTYAYALAQSNNGNTIVRANIFDIYTGASNTSAGTHAARFQNGISNFFGAVTAPSYTAEADTGTNSSNDKHVIRTTQDPNDTTKKVEEWFTRYTPGSLRTLYGWRIHSSSTGSSFGYPLTLSYYNSSNYYVGIGTDSPNVVGLTVIGAGYFSGTVTATSYTGTWNGNAIVTAKIADLNVTTAKIADNAITNDKLGGQSVDTTALRDLNVTTAKIAANAVTGAKVNFSSDAITTAGISSNKTFSASPSTFGDAQVCFGDSTSNFASLQAGGLYGGLFNKQGTNVLRFEQGNSNIELFSSLYVGNLIRFDVSSSADKALNVVGSGNPCNSIVRFGQSMTAGGYICYDNQNNGSHSLGDWSENTSEGFAIGIYASSTYYPFISGKYADKASRTCKMHGPIVVTGDITATGGDITATGTTLELGGSTTNTAKLITFSNQCRLEANVGQQYARMLQFSSNGWVYNMTLSGSYSTQGFAAYQFYSSLGNAYIYQNSDARLKTDIQPADTSACYERVKNIRVHTYGYIPSYGAFNNVPAETRTLGFIADEVETVIPEAVVREENLEHPMYDTIGSDFPDKENTFGNGNGLKSIKQDRLVKELWGAVQVLMAKVETLEHQIASNQVLKRSFAEISEEQT
ncbi:tail fiber domain-containing protein [Nereida ignava]|uniref:tail fiber domain-containing protein n=1 Tax=Nereida ignava TaxID=282199 RepID=UPI0030F9F87B